MISLRPAARSDREAGNAPLELIILAPIVIALIGLMIGAGRTTMAQGAVDAAARDAARQASLARTEAGAQAAAQLSAGAELAQDGLHCTPQVLPLLGPSLTVVKQENMIAADSLRELKEDLLFYPLGSK